MKQNYNNYTVQDHQVWQTLFERQKRNLRKKACKEYLDCLEEMSLCFQPEHIPDFNKVNKMLLKKTGWSIEVVKGLIPVEDFFELLAQKKICSSTWLRGMLQLDYLEEPDMFHDTFGHIPLLINPVFASFMEEFGKTGCEHANNAEVIKQLQRLYWFTIEFGLIGNKNERKIFGAGIISSFGETNHVFEKNLDIRPFEMNEVLNQQFRTDLIQTTYFSLESFEQLFEEMNRLRCKLNRRREILV
jgi:phenylalanine-4-hydroxylase